MMKEVQPNIIRDNGKMIERFKRINVVVCSRCVYCEAIQAREAQARISSLIFTGIRYQLQPVCMCVKHFHSQPTKNHVTSKPAQFFICHCPSPHSPLCLGLSLVLAFPPLPSVSFESSRWKVILALQKSSFYSVIDSVRLPFEVLASVIL